MMQTTPKKTFIYQPGERPVPMLGYEDQPHESAFLNDYQFGVGQFTRAYKHIWNINGYIIYDPEKLIIQAYKFNELIYVIWLLRILNKPFEITFTEALIEQERKTFKACLESQELVEK